ncbi:MAG: hypothetical protein DCC52_16680 [Chloroflexi bacterium]|nr:MAG: hypothetical protein DCC52_16680 [Chloroflexota bacterium]
MSYNAQGLDPQRTINDLKELRALTGDENGAQRVAFTDTWIAARKFMREKLEDLPIEVEVDEAGNQWATLVGKSDDTLLIGGHIDSVPKKSCVTLPRKARRRSRSASWIGRTKKARVSGARSLVHRPYRNT